LTRQFGGGGFGRGNDRGRQNIQVQYFAGGAIMFNEVVTVPTSGAYTVSVSQAQYFWADLAQVFYATPQNGQLVELTLVTGPPAQGQYSVNSSGVYTFNVADAGQTIGITYGYNAAMPDLQMACIMQVAETLFSRKTIGMRSKGAEGETTSYSKYVFTPDVLRVVLKYKRAMSTGG
jgi:hypothetical protein